MSRTKKNAMVISSDENKRAALKEPLEKFGASIMEFSTHDEAHKFMVDAFTRKEVPKIDLIVMDYTTGREGMDGTRFIEQMKLIPESGAGTGNRIAAYMIRNSDALPRDKKVPGINKIVENTKTDINRLKTILTNVLRDKSHSV